jgi:hypothetical protein
MTYGITQQRVDAQNQINALANEIEGHLLRLLSDWQQKKAFKTSGYGGKVAALEKAFDAYCASHGYNAPAGEGQTASSVWVNLYRQYNSVAASVQILLNNGQRVEMHLGRTDDAGTLISLGDGHKRRTDYTVAEIEGALSQAYDLEEKARQLRSSVRDFQRR